MLSTNAFWLASAFQAVAGIFNDLVTDVTVSGASCPRPLAEADFDGNSNSFPLSTWRKSKGMLRVKLPNQFSTTGFVRQKLSKSETLSLFDIPSTKVQDYSDALLGAIGSSFHVSLKVLVPIGRCIGYARECHKEMRIGGGY
jgi:hypothetical protein